MIPMPPWPVFAQDEIDAVSRVLASGKVNYWTGEHSRAFEQEFAAFVGTSHAIALANGTVALELALLALGIGAGDEVLVPSRTFIATASAVAARGARPVCTDVDLVTQTVTPSTLAPHVSERTRAIIVVHLAGWPAPMDEIMNFARERNLYVIEDCAQSHGARLHGSAAGSWGDVGTFSFCQDKIMTTGGEGGMLVTNDTSVWRRSWEYKDHGKSWEAVYERSHPPGFRWLHESFGTNWRMTEMQAAIGRLALKKLPAWLQARQSHATTLNRCLRGYPFFRCEEPPQGVEHAYYKYYFFVRPEKLPSTWTRDRVLSEIQNEGIPCFTGSCSEIYLEKAFTDRDWQPAARFKNARELGETSLMLQVHPTLTPANLEDVCRALDRVAQRIQSQERQQR